MKKTLKLTSIRKNELQKEDMQLLFGGDSANCPSITCSCSCNCPLGNQTEKETSTQGAKNSVSRSGSTQNVGNITSSDYFKTGMI